MCACMYECMYACMYVCLDGCECVSISRNGLWEMKRTFLENNSSDRSSDALISTGRKLERRAMTCASVVFPNPGGPLRRRRGAKEFVDFSFSSFLFICTDSPSLFSRDLHTH